MRLYPILLFLFVATLTFQISGCSYDDPDRRPRVVYRVTAANDQITAIRFRGFNAQINSVATGQVSGNWSQQVQANTPFNANLGVDFNNMTENPMGYSLQIFVNDSLRNSKTGVIAPGEVLSDVLIQEVTN